MGYNTVAMPTIQAGKITTYYQRIGSGPFLVLLHGWANTWEAWSPLIAPLSEKFTLLIPDLPGFGKSSTPSELDWTTHNYASWLRDFTGATIGTKPFGAIGHSYGGKILTYYCAHMFSPIPRKIVLIGPSGVMNTLSPSKKTVSTFTKMTPRALKNLAPQSLVRWFYEHIVGETDYVHANAFQKPVLRNILAEDFTQEMAAIKTPTLILWGELDRSSPTEKAEIFHKQIRGSTLKIIANAGHFPHHEKPQEVLAALREFLK
jgi:pimeloyl-ACP methyl ester carboxylesterase